MEIVKSETAIGDSLQRQEERFKMEQEKHKLDMDKFLTYKIETLQSLMEAIVPTEGKAFGDGTTYQAALCQGNLDIIERKIMELVKKL